MNDTRHRPPGPFHPCRLVDASFYDDAPVRFVFDVDLEATPEQLFAIFEDASSWKKWTLGNIRGVEWTSPKPFGPGTTRTVTLPTGLLVFEDFIVWDAPRQMAFCFYGANQEVWKAFGERYAVQDLGEGRCHLTWTVAYEPAARFARVHPWIKPVMRLALGSYMWGLKRYCGRLHR